MIGQQGGRQQVSLASPGCLQKGVAVHEIMHALGFFHEQSRLDRDTYIRINWANINSGELDIHSGELSVRWGELNINSGELDINSGELSAK